MNAELFERETPNYSATTFPPPRPFQDKAHQALRDGAKAGHRCQMLMSPTGSGKTYLGLRIAHEALVRGKRALFIADRRTLIDQTSQTADGYGLSAHAVLMASHWRYDPSMPFQIASAQTLARREWPRADVIIIDEAHTQLAVWVDYIQTCEAKVIGLSATPFSAGLGKLFTNLVNAATMNELTESGVLVPMRVKSCVPINMEGAATSGGEWTDAAAGERGMEIVGDVVAEWLQHGENRKTIVFGSTIAHCAELCKSFNEAGVMAQLFTSETTEEERKSILAEYRKPDTPLRVLISVEALAKGFDVPDVSCVVDCRPLRKSLSTAIQMWGRGLRSSPATGKTDCLLLDHSGNIIRFADDYSDIFFNGLNALDAGEKLDKAIRKDDKDHEPKACPACGFKPMGKRCVSCGFEVVQAAAIEAIPGHMREVMIGKQKAADNHAHLYAQVVSYARGHGNPETAKGRAAHLFKHIVGKWPDGFSYERTHNVPISKPVLNKIREKQIAYRAAQAQAA
ncbi:MAG TPA: DEAD/DEAH box helicase family protein [Roseateles sp.]